MQELVEKYFTLQEEHDGLINSSCKKIAKLESDKCDL